MTLTPEARARIEALIEHHVWFEEHAVRDNAGEDRARRDSVVAADLTAALAEIDGLREALADATTDATTASRE